MGKKGKSGSFLQEELITRLAIQERSLKTFVKEIYENVNQALALVKLQLAAIDLQNKAGSEQALKESTQLVAQAINDLRTLVKQLSPDEIIRQGFAEAISIELERLGKSGIFNTSFQSRGEYYKLDPARELIIFGTIQGLICRILAADKIGHLHIEVDYLPQEIAISIRFTATKEKDIGTIINSTRKKKNEMQVADSTLVAGKDADDNKKGFFNLLIKSK
jgi:two-component system NarL family sensor kinase